MDALECIMTRRSVRKFTEQPIEFDKLAKIVHAGTYAPSAGNLQNFRFILITEKGLLHALYEHCMKQEAIYHAQVAIVVTSEEDQTELMYGLMGKRLYSVQNCAAATENILLAAHALGLGACWIGAFDEDKIRSMLDIEDHARPQAIIALGYPDEEPVVHKRDLQGFVHFNAYGLKVKDVDFLLRDFSLVWEKELKKGFEKGKKRVRRIKDLFRIWQDKNLKRKGIRKVIETEEEDREKKNKNDHKYLN
jgi:nitroreductase